MQVSETETPDSDGESSSTQSLALRDLQPAATPSSAWKEGVNYKRLSPVQPTSAMPGQIEVTEALLVWLGSLLRAGPVDGSVAQTESQLR